MATTELTMAFFPHVCAYFSFLQFRSSVNNAMREIHHIFLRPFPIFFFQHLGKCNHQHFRKAELFGNDFGNRLKKSLVMLAVSILMDSKTG